MITFIFATSFLKIAAIVGNEPIFDRDVREIARVMMLSPLQQEKDTLKVYSTVLEQLISYNLLKELMEKESLKVSSEEVNSRVEQYLQMIKSNFPDDSTYNLFLKQSGLTEERLKKIYSKEIERQLMAQMILNKKGITLYVSPKEIRDFYEEYKDSLAYIPEIVELSQIALVVMPSPAKEKRAQKKISEIYAILMQNADFDVVASSFSEDTETKNKGGLIKIKRGDFPPEVEKILFSLRPGQISEPMRLQDGYYIFKCVRRGVNEGTFRKIFVKVVPDRDDTLRTIKKAEKIRKEFLEGKDFHELARKYSQDLQTAKNGGRMGAFMIENLFSPFKEIADTLKVGQCSKPFVSNMGVHLLYVDSRQERRERTFEEVKEEIYYYLLQKKQMKYINEILEDMRESTYIEKRMYKEK